MISPCLMKVVNHSFARLDINQQPCRDDLNQRTSQDFMRVQGQKGWQDAKEGMVRMAQEGKRMMQIEKGEKNVIQHIAWENTDMTKEFNIDFLPKHKPAVTYIPAQLDIEYTGKYFDLKR